MHLKILDSGLGGGEARQYASSYLVNEVLAIDAGCLGFWKTPADQARIRHVLLTHCHMDHIASLPQFLENTVRPGSDSATVYALPETIEALERHIFNDVIWPNFARIVVNGKPFLRWQPVLPGQPFEAAGLTATAIPVNHIVPACGFVITDQSSTLIFGGDSGPTSELWEAAGKAPLPRTVLLEACFPDDMRELATISGHLTPGMFAAELAKLPEVDQIVAVHMKEAFRSQIERELAALGLPHVKIGIHSPEHRN